MAKTDARTSPVGRLLKRWRAVRNLSQLELALQANVSARHISFVETGRAEPSREMVLRLADALDLPLAERNAVLVAAGFAPLHPARPLESEALARVRHVLQRMLDNHEPYPAVCLDAYFNVRLWNTAMMQLFGFLEYLPPPPTEDQPLSMFLPIFDPDGLRPYLLDWEDVARTTLRRAQREDAARGGDPELQRLIDRALTFPDVPRDWQRSAPVDSDLPCLSFALAHRGQELRWFSTLTTFGTPQDVTVQGIHIESFFPADDATEERWAALLSGA